MARYPTLCDRCARSNDREICRPMGAEPSADAVINDLLSDRYKATEVTGDETVQLLRNRDLWTRCLEAHRAIYGAQPTLPSLAESIAADHFTQQAAFCGRWEEHEGSHLFRLGRGIRRPRVSRELNLVRGCTESGTHPRFGPPRGAR